jgi:hypothetical protein
MGRGYMGSAAVHKQGVRVERLFFSYLCKMKSVYLCLSVLLCAASASAAARPPWFCHDLDCPQYTVGDVNDDYEVRTYAKGASGQTAACWHPPLSFLCCPCNACACLQASGPPRTLRATCTARRFCRASRCCGPKDLVAWLRLLCAGSGCIPVQHAAGDGAGE